MVVTDGYNKMSDLLRQAYNQLDYLSRLALWQNPLPMPKRKVVKLKKPVSDIKGKDLSQYKMHYEEIKPKKF